MKKIIANLFFLLCFAGFALAQTQQNQITGTVTDEKGEPMIGVSISVKNEAGLGTMTDVNGKYKIKASRNSILVFSYVGYDRQEVEVNDKTVVDAQMKNETSSVLDEVVITGAGAQRKASVSGAITTVDVKTLKMPTSNITNALAGNVAGVISMQIGGEPGSNQSEFWIRGISTFGAGSSALVLVDGFERPFNEINVEDIESFSVLKDASATAIYGSRGANGVIIITTKKGTSGKININAKAEYGYNTRTRTPDFVDGYDYATLINEARRTRNLEPLFTNDELDIIKYNLDPDLYPNIDWKKLLLRNGASTYRMSVNLDGGGSTARYFVSASYVNEGGMYKTDAALKDYNTNSNYERYNYRLNTDVDVTKTTLLRLGVGGFLEKQNRAGLAIQYVIDKETGLPTNTLELVNGGGINIWKSIAGYSPIATPIIYENGLTPAYSTGEYTNPWVLATQTGYNEMWRSKIETNITLEQNFDFITKGLRFNGRFAFDSDSRNNVNHRRWPEQHNTQRRRDSNGNLVFYRVSTEALMNQSTTSWGERVYNLEAELSYNRKFLDAHNVSLFAKYSQREVAETSDVGDDVQRGIPRRDQSYSGRLSYDFMSRYFVELNGGYTGSEVFRSGQQFGFFPAISGAWNISEEPFVKSNTNFFDLLKVRYSYGKVGNNQISNNRFPYLGEISRTNGYKFGEEGTTSQWWEIDGLQITRLEVDLIWEVATKHNFGLDFNIWHNKISGSFDIYQDTRSNIYMQRNNMGDYTGLRYLYNPNSGSNRSPWANVGKMQNQGFDGQLNFNQTVGEVELTMRGNITYAHNKVLEYDEEASALPYKMTQGYRWQQAKGLIALGLFESWEDIRNSPTQEFGTYMPGDIKYKDINGDGKINDDDKVAIGAARVPSLVYGVGMSAMWRGIDVNVHFQGAGKSSYFINGPAVYPFSEFVAGNTLPWGNILTDLLGNYWSEENPNTNAKYPRLSYGGNSNNYRESTYWLRDGAYLRFKTLEVGYTVPKQYTNLLAMNRVRVYFIGTNLFVWDTLKLWDPELGSGNGMAYPPSKSFTFGLTITL